MSTVYIIQRSDRHDFGPVLEYGTIKYIFEQNGILHATPQALRKRVSEALAKFNPETDFVLLNGDPVAIGLVTADLETTHTNYRVLRFDRAKQGYTLIQL